MVLQLNGSEPAFQIRQTARPIEFEAALGGAHGFRRSRLRQKLDECLHLFLRHFRQSFIFGDQGISTHNKNTLPATSKRCNPTLGRLTGPILRAQAARAGEEGIGQAYGAPSATWGKYFLNRSWSRVAIFQPMISPCAPMKKSFMASITTLVSNSIMARASFPVVRPTTCQTSSWKPRWPCAPPPVFFSSAEQVYSGAPEGNGRCLRSQRQTRHPAVRLALPPASCCRRLLSWWDNPTFADEMQARFQFNSPPSASHPCRRGRRSRPVGTPDFPARRRRNSTGTRRSERISRGRKPARRFHRG